MNYAIVTSGLMGCGMPAGNAYPSGHLVPFPIVELACAPIVETRFLELAMSLLNFSSRIPLGTFSIFPWFALSTKYAYFPVSGSIPQYSRWDSTIWRNLESFAKNLKKKKKCLENSVLRKKGKEDMPPGSMKRWSEYTCSTFTSVEYL